MKIFVVNYGINHQQLSFGAYPRSHMQTRTFSTKENAEKFREKVYEAASFLNITGLLETNIEETEID